jgi:tRNA(Ile)-lysidine synthase
VRGSEPLRELESAVRERAALRRGETVLAAISGGPDSVALAALLARCADEEGATIVLGHVNHGVRDRAGQDEAVVLALGAALGLRVLVRALAPGPADEQRLREERYRHLAGLAAGIGAGRVFTAHHAGDQTESVLLALFRGSGPDGVAGMPERRELAPGVSLERPLLRRSRDELVRYAQLRRFAYAHDASNDEPERARNAIRAALAGLRDAFPRLDEAVARYAEIAGARSERAALRALLRDEIVRGGGGRDLTFERLEAAARAVEAGNEGRIFLAPGVEIHLKFSRVSSGGASNTENSHLAGPATGQSDATSGRIQGTP